MWESGLLGDVEREVYEAFVGNVGERERMGRRVRKVGLWGLGCLVQALVVGLAGRVA